MRAYSFLSLRFIVVILFGVVFLTNTTFGQDVSGSKDHPLISRYPNSVIRKYTTRDFDEYLLPMGSVPNKGLQFGNTKRVEGKFTEILYEVLPESSPRSTLEVHRNYESALEQAGFQTLFSCSDQQCGDYAWVVMRIPNPSSQRLLTSQLSRPEGDIYVSLYVVQTSTSRGSIFVTLNIVEAKPMESGLVMVSSEVMAKGIESEGHVAIYGIYFDFDKAEIKSNSEPTLIEIAKFLRLSPDLKIIVVGHTDSVGTMAYNIELSERRAQAVMNALVSRFGIDQKRLTAKGVGFLAPIASNKTEEGRAKNRRVELVGME